MRAFAHARDLGVRHIETDAHLSADGVVVLHHDPFVDRTYDGTGLIANLTWQEISRLRDPEGGRMPLLSEALEAFPDLYFNIDAKVPEVVGPLLEILDSHGAYGRVLIASFSEERLHLIRAAVGNELTTSLGVRAVVRLMGAAATASSPVRWGVPGPKLGVRAVQVPESFGGIRLVTPRFLASAHRAGLAVHVWTVNDAAQMMRLVDLGVDGIMTDRPTEALGLLQARGLRESFAPPAS